MDNKIKTDRRIIKTKKAIRNAFAQLLSEKDIDAITIKDIADTADINRKTFYNYYSGVHQVIYEIENELVCDFEKMLSEIDPVAVMRQPYIIFERLTNMINSDFDFYGHLLTANRNSMLVIKITESLIRAIKQSFSAKMDLDDSLLDITVKYTVSGMISVYQDWFNSNRRQSLEEIAHIVGILCFEGINGTIRNSKWQ